MLKKMYLFIILLCLAPGGGCADRKKPVTNSSKSLDAGYEGDNANPLLVPLTLDEMTYSDETTDFSFAYSFQTISVGLASNALGAPSSEEVLGERADLSGKLALVASTSGVGATLALLNLESTKIPHDDYPGSKYYHTYPIQADRYLADIKPKDPSLAPVEYFESESERARFEVDILNNKLVYKSSRAPVNVGLREGIFVMDAAGRIYINQHERWKFHHSTFLGGRPVAAGGHIQVREGVLEAFDHQTGHYLLGPDSNVSFVRELEYRGLKIPNVKIGIIKGATVTELTKVYKERNISLPEGLQGVATTEGSAAKALVEERQKLTEVFLKQRSLYSQISSLDPQSPQHKELRETYELSLKSSHEIIAKQSERRVAFEPPRPGAKAAAQHGSWAVFGQVLVQSLMR